MADNNSDLFEQNIREINEALNQFNSLLRNNNDLSEDGSDAMKDFTKTLRDAEAISKKNKQLREQALAQLKQGLGSFNNALLDSSAGLTKYNAGMTAAGDAAWAVGKSLGPLGVVAGGLVKAFTFLVGQANRYNEALVKNYNNLSDSGATVGLFTEELKNMAHNVGLTTHNMDVLFNNTKDLGVSLLSLGNTASDGMINFSKMAESTKELRAEYAALGLSTEDVIALNAQLVRTGTINNIASTRNTKDTAKAAQSLIKEMVTLAELTGVSVQKQMESLEFARANEAYAIFELNKQRERDELRAASAAALQKGDREEARRLEMRAASIDKELKVNEELIRSTSKYDQATRTGVLEAIATGGAMTKNTIHLTNLGVNFEKIVEGLRKGESQIYNFDKAMSVNIQKMSGSLGELAAFAPGIVTEVFGLSPENIKAIKDTRRMMDTLSKEEFEAKMLELAARNLRAKTESDRALQSAQVAKEADLATRRTEDALGKLSSEITTGVMNKFFQFIAKVNQSLEELITGIGNYVRKIKGWFGVADDVEKEIRRKEEVRQATQPPPAPTTSGAITTPTGTPMDSNKKITGIVQAGKGFITVETEDGQRQRREGARNWRNNNPGNIEYGNYAKAKGAIGSDGRFAVFPTLETGQKAKQDLIFGKNYINLSIADAISRYAPPSENDTANYIRQILQATGASSSTTLSELSDAQRRAMLQAIDRVEGFKEGKITPARLGGIFSGPQTGYPIEMHGTEMVTPLDANSILAKLAQTSATEIDNALQTQNNASTEMVAVLVDKLNAMIDRLDNSNDIQSQILTYARV